MAPSSRRSTNAIQKVISNGVEEMEQSVGMDDLTMKKSGHMLSSPPPRQKPQIQQSLMLPPPFHSRSSGGLSQRQLPMQTQEQAPGEENIKVAIRLKPLKQAYSDDGDVVQDRRAWRVKHDENTIIQQYRSSVDFGSNSNPLPPAMNYSYTFDEIFSEDATTQQVYNGVVRDIVNSVTHHGKNGTVFAYGQTSSGKTFTMQGDSTNEGIVHMACRDVFAHIANDPINYSVKVSFLEIYNEEVRDLLVPHGPSVSYNSLAVREDIKRGVFVESLTDHTVHDMDALLKWLRFGEKQKSVSATGMNDRSSRSHTIFRISIEKKQQISSQTDNADVASLLDLSDTATATTFLSHLNLVDLAGSESVRHTGAQGRRQREGGKINQSLLTLSRVIMSLGQATSAHINYRDSKLTRILQPSLSGNARMAVICCATLSDLYVEETRTTFLFATRAKLVKTRAEVNEVHDDETSSLIRRLQLELAKRTLEGKEAMTRLRQLEQYVQRTASDEEEKTTRIPQFFSQEDLFQSLVDRNQWTSYRPKKRQRIMLQPLDTSSAMTDTAKVYCLSPTHQLPFPKLQRRHSLGSIEGRNRDSTSATSTTPINALHSYVSPRWNNIVHSDSSILHDALVLKSAQIQKLEEEICDLRDTLEQREQPPPQVVMKRDRSSLSLQRSARSRDSDINDETFSCSGEDLKGKIKELIAEKNDALDWIEELYSQADTRELKMREILQEREALSNELETVKKERNELKANEEGYKLKMPQTPTFTERQQHQFFTPLEEISENTPFPGTPTREEVGTLERGQLMERVEKLSQEKSVTQKMIQQLNQEAEKMKTENKALHQQVKQIQMGLQSSKERYDDLLCEYHSLREENTAEEQNGLTTNETTDQDNKQEKQMIILRERNRNLSDENEHLGKMVTELNEAIARSDEHVSDLLSKVQSSTQLVSQMEQFSATLEENFEEEKAKLLQQKIDVSAQLEVAENFINQMIDIKSDSEENHPNSSGDGKTLRLENARLRHQMNHLREEIELLKDRATRAALTLTPPSKFLIGRPLSERRLQMAQLENTGAPLHSLTELLKCAQDDLDLSVSVDEPTPMKGSSFMEQSPSFESVYGDEQEGQLEAELASSKAEVVDMMRLLGRAQVDILRIAGDSVLNESHSENLPLLMDEAHEQSISDDPKSEEAKRKEGEKEAEMKRSLDECREELTKLKLELKETEVKSNDIQFRSHNIERENDELKKDIESKNLEVMSLQGEIHKLSDVVRSSRDERDRTNADKENIDQELTRIKDERSLLFVEKEEKQKTISSLRSELEELLSINRTLCEAQEAKRSLEDKLRELADTIEEQRSEISSLQGQIDTITTESHSTHLQMEKLSAEKDRVERDLASVALERSSLRNEIETLSRTVGNSESKINSLEGEVQRLTDQAGGMREVVEKVSAEKNSLEQDLAVIKKENLSLRDESRARVEASDNQKLEIEGLNDAVQCAKAETEKVSAEKGAFEEKFISSDQARRSLEDEVKLLNNSLDERKLESTSLQSKVEDLTKEVCNIKEEREVVYSEKRAIEKELASALDQEKRALEEGMKAAVTHKSQLLSLQGEVARLGEEAQRRKTEVEETSEELAKTKTERHALSEELRTLSETVEVYKLEISSLKGKVEVLTQEAKCAKEEVHNISDKNNEMNAKFVSSSQEKHALQEEMRALSEMSQQYKLKISSLEDRIEKQTGEAKHAKDEMERVCAEKDTAFDEQNVLRLKIVEERDRTISMLRSEREGCNEKIKRMETEVSTLLSEQQTNGELQSKLLSMQREMEELRQMLERTQNEKAEVGGQLSLLATTHKQTTIDADATIESLKKDKATLSKENEDLESKMRAMDASMEHVRKLLDEASADKMSLIEEKAACLERVAQLERSVDDIKAECIAQSDRCQSDMTEQLELAKNAALDRVEEQKSQIVSLSAEIDGLRNDAKTVAVEKASLLDSLTALQTRKEEEMQLSGKLVHHLSEEIRALLQQLRSDEETKITMTGTACPETEVAVVMFPHNNQRPYSSPPELEKEEAEIENRSLSMESPADVDASGVKLRGLLGEVKNLAVSRQAAQVHAFQQLHELQEKNANIQARREEEIATFQRQVLELEEALEFAKQQQRDGIDQVNTEKHRLEDAAKIQELNFASLRTETNELRKAKEDLTARIASLAHELDAERRAHEEARHHDEGTSAERQQLEEELKSLRAEIECLRKSAAATSATTNATLEDNKCLLEEQRRVIAETESLSLLVEEKKELESSLYKERLELTALRGQVEHLQQSLGMIQTELDEQLADAEKRQSSMEESYEHQIEKLSQEVSSIKKENAEIKELRESSKKETSDASTLTEGQDEQEETQKALKENEKAIANMTTKDEKQRAEIASLKSDLKKLKASTESTEELLELHKTQLADEENTGAQLEEENQALKMTIDVQRSEISSLRTEGQELRDEIMLMEKKQQKHEERVVVPPSPALKTVLDVVQSEGSKQHHDDEEEEDVMITRRVSTDESSYEHNPEGLDEEEEYESSPRDDLIKALERNAELKEIIEDFLSTLSDVMENEDGIDDARSDLPVLYESPSWSDELPLLEEYREKFARFRDRSMQLDSLTREIDMLEETNIKLQISKDSIERELEDMKIQKLAADAVIEYLTGQRRVWSLLACAVRPHGGGGGGGRRRRSPGAHGAHE